MTINKCKNHWQQHQAHLWGLKPPHHTHLGNRFFEIEYINIIQDSFSLLILVPERGTLILIYYPGTGTWHPIHILSWCRNVTLRSSYTILVPERGTRSIYYPGVGTWHPIHILSWYRNVAPDPHILSWYQNVAPDPLISLLSFIKPSFIPRHHH